MSYGTNPRGDACGRFSLAYRRFEDEVFVFQDIWWSKIVYVCMYVIAKV